MAGSLLSGAVSAVGLLAAVSANVALALAALLVTGRMPRRFYSAADGAARLRTAASHLFSSAAVLACAALVGAACASRALLRRLALPPAAERRPLLLRGVPACRWMEHATVKIRNIKLHYVTAGNSKRRMLLFLHGFPEFWYSWKNQLEDFSKTEWVVALDLPGYGDSDSPGRAALYSPEALVPLLLEFIAALGRDECVLVASDHGALLGWHLVQRSPQTFTHFVSISQPIPHVTLDILESSLHHKLRQWRCFLYQLPWLPEYLIASGDLDILDAEYGPLLKSGRLSPEDMQAHQFAFSRPEDWRGPLNYQRSLFLACNRVVPAERVGVPSLLLAGRRDRSLPADAVYRSLAFLRESSIQLVEDAGRHLQLERPETVSRLIREFIGVIAEPEEPEQEQGALDGQSGRNRSLAQRALEGGQGWLDAGSALYNVARERVNAATAMGELYTRSVMLLRD